jgi:hypothetical protein
VSHSLSLLKLRNPETPVAIIANFDKHLKAVTFKHFCIRQRKLGDQTQVAVHARTWRNHVSPAADAIHYDRATPDDDGILRGGGHFHLIPA